MNQIKPLVEAVRGAVRAHINMKRASADKADLAARQKYQRELYAAMEKLTTVAIAFEKDLQENPTPKKPVDWLPIMRAGAGFVDLVLKAREGTLKGADVKTYIDVSATEVLDTKKSPTP